MATMNAVTAKPEFQADWGCQLMERQPEFLRADTVLEIGAGDFSRTIALAMRHPAKRFIAADLDFGPAAIRNVAVAAGFSNTTFIRANMLDPYFAGEMFDFVFSIGVMEHIAQPEKLFSNLHKWLKPRGVYAYFQAPFWTCRKGHHYRHDEQDIRRILNAYEHIRFTQPEMREFLARFDDLPFDPSHCLNKIYVRPDLSRLSVGESLRSVQASEFVIDAWQLREDVDFDRDKAEVALRAHVDRYTMDDFRFDAVFARLLKR
jgi:SAM-dependent methyltransferase